VRRRLEADPEMLRQGPTAALYSIADATVDHYLGVATELQTDLEGLEAEVFSPSGGGSRHTASRIYTFKRQILEFRRATGPLTVPLTRLSGSGTAGAPMPFVHEKAHPFFRDVNDHLARVNESVESLDRLVSDILSAHLAQMSVRQNDDMRKISAWAAMAAVPTMIAGIYGMNFDHMPELHWLWSYPAVILAMATLEFLLYHLFKRRGWL
jgi:magnesium transporter